MEMPAERRVREKRAKTIYKDAHLTEAKVSAERCRWNRRALCEFRLPLNKYSCSRIDFSESQLTLPNSLHQCVCDNYHIGLSGHYVVFVWIHSVLRDCFRSAPDQRKLSKMAKHVRASMQPDYAVNIFACLDRFSLDSVGFTCPTLKGIVAKHLPEEPLRVLKSVTVEWHEDRLIATLVPESPLGKAMTRDDADENDFEEGDYDARCESVLRKTAALCANSFVKFFKMEECGRWWPVLHAFKEHLPGIRIQRLMLVDYGYAHEQEDVENVDVSSRVYIELHITELALGVESLVMKTVDADIDDESLQLLKENGIRRLAIEDLNNFDFGEDAVRAFCIGGPEPADTVAPDRSLFLHQADLSFEFLQQLAQECLAADVSRMPTLTFYRYTYFVPPLPKAHARHKKAGRRCLHFRFHAAAGPYEIVAQSQGNRMWKVSLRGGHSAVRRCSYMFRREHLWSEG